MAFEASRSPHPEVRGWIGVEGIYDLKSLAKRWPAYPEWFLNRAFGPSSQEWPEWRTLRSTVPWLVVHSNEDELVDRGQSETFVEHLRKQKVPAEMRRLEAGSHFGVLDRLVQPGSESAGLLKWMEALP